MKPAAAAFQSLLPDGNPIAGPHDGDRNSVPARSRLAIVVILAFVAFAVLSAATFGWYGYRVFTELQSGSWRTPTKIVDRDGEPLLELYGAEWRRTDRST